MIVNRCIAVNFSLRATWLSFAALKCEHYYVFVVNRYKLMSQRAFQKDDVNWRGGVKVLFLTDGLLDCHWWDIILTNSAERKSWISLLCLLIINKITVIAFALNLMSKATHLLEHQFMNSLQLKDSSHLQSLLCRLRCHPLLLLWRLSLFGSCALPSAWSWRTAALLLWSLHLRPCRTNQRKERRRMKKEGLAVKQLPFFKKVWRGCNFKGEALDSHLFKGVFELLHANHPGRFCQKLRGHQLYEVLKVDSAANWRQNQKKRCRNSETSITLC